MFVEGLPKDSHFTMIGTVRGPSDQAIVDDLEKYATELGIRDSISFEINANRDRIFEIFAQAKVAMHTMKFEHFGIAIVELMSSGIITVAHKSAGPLKDIIGKSPEPVGYLAEDVNDYAFAVKMALAHYEYP
jgi:alpha-1,2-mannosyltransferase